MGKVVGVTFFPYLKILLQFAITMCAITTMFSNDFSDEKETVVVLELPHITEKKWWCYFYVNLRLPFLYYSNNNGKKDFGQLSNLPEELLRSGDPRDPTQLGQMPEQKKSQILFLIISHHHRFVVALFAKILCGQ